MKFRIRSAWLSSLPVEFMLSKNQLGVVLIAGQGDIHPRHRQIRMQQLLPLAMDIGLFPQFAAKISQLRDEFAHIV